MPLPSVTPADVAAYAPDAPAVTPRTCDEANDWLAETVERFQLLQPTFVVLPASRNERRLLRAACAYALYLGATSSPVVLQDGRLLRAEKLGDVENQYADPAVQVQVQSQVGAEWLAKAWQALGQAGVRFPRVVAVSA